MFRWVQAAMSVRANIWVVQTNMTARTPNRCARHRRGRVQLCIYLARQPRGWV